MVYIRPQVFLYASSYEMNKGTFPVRFLWASPFPACSTSELCQLGFCYIPEMETQNSDRPLSLTEHIISLVFLTVWTFWSHRKLSSVPTKENPLKALLELVLALNSGVRLTELGTISLVNSGSMCWVSAGPLWKTVWLYLIIICLISFNFHFIITDATKGTFWFKKQMSKQARPFENTPVKSVINLKNNSINTCLNQIKKM